MVVTCLVIHLYTSLVASFKTMGIICFIAYTQYRHVILVSRLVTRSKLLLNTLVSYYRKQFGNLNPPRFSIDGKYPGTNRNLKLSSVSDLFVKSMFYYGVNDVVSPGGNWCIFIFCRHKIFLYLQLNTFLVPLVSILLYNHTFSSYSKWSPFTPFHIFKDMLQS